MFSTVFFDLDDTLYPAGCGLWRTIKDRMNLYMIERLHIPAEEVPALREKLFREYGTTLRGLERHYPVDVADYLAFVHAVPLRDYIKPDPRLRAALEKLPARKLIFTNADVAHAVRVMNVIGVRDCFDGIIDVNAIAPYCKPMPESFEIALKLAGERDPRQCVMIDDLPRTTKAAHEFGLFSILFGQPESHPDADAVLNDWDELNELLRHAYK